MKKKNLPELHYKPAKLYTPDKSCWEVKFWYKDPLTDKFKLFKRRVKSMTSENERYKLGKQIEKAINKKLDSGWSPYDKVNRSYYLHDMIEIFKLHTEKKYKNGSFRFDTRRSYISNITKFQRFLNETYSKKITSDHFDKQVITAYIDHMEFSLKNSGKTINNNVTFLKILCNFFVDHGYLSLNPVTRIRKKHEDIKKRKIIPNPHLRLIFDYLRSNNPGFYCLSLMCFYCFLRRTELTKIRVKSISLKDHLIFVPGTISKNRKDDFITIPDIFIPVLENHLNHAQPEHYIFSKNGYQPGEKMASAKQITYTWEKLKNALEFSSDYNFYSLKDTGITKLLEKGVPTIKVRDQARHHDIKITEKYTPRRTEADTIIRNAYDDF